jgi:hypothetical protein
MLIIAAVICIGSYVTASSGTAQGYSGNPALAAYREYQQSITAYQKCLADNQKNEDACQEQHHTMDANAQVWSTYPESKTQDYFGVPLGTPRR